MKKISLILVASSCLVLGLFLGTQIQSADAKSGYYIIKVQGIKCVTNGGDALSCDF